MTAALTVEPPAAAGHARGDAAFRRLLLALLCAGFATFGLLYAPQPLLPQLASDFRISPAAASLAVSTATGALALGLLAAGPLADRLGRKRVMSAALFAAVALTGAAALAPSWTAMVVLRALAGLALAGVPATAMAHLTAETEPGSAAYAMGLYVAATATGGMAGRLGCGFAAEALGWRGALALTAAAGAIAAALFAGSLPPARSRPPAPPLREEVAAEAAAMCAALSDPARRWLFAEAFLLMGGFVTVYNYLPFRLAAPPYGLGQAEQAAVFALYAAGIVASAVTGALVARLGRPRVLWGAIAVAAAGLALTAVRPLAGVVAGVGLFTFGFFAAHATASGWVGERGGGARATGASLYLLAYYAGSSLLGTAGGRLWSAAGWPGVAGGVAAALALAALGAWRLASAAARHS